MGNLLQRISVNPNFCGGQPCIRGLSVPVSLVRKYLTAGRTPPRIVDEFPVLELAEVSECLKYSAWPASGQSIELPSAG